LSRTPTQAQPPLEFIPPNLDWKVVWASRYLMPLWRRLFTDVRQIHASHVERLVELYRQFQAGEARFLLAFRHPSVNDPLCMSYLLSTLVPKTARQMGISLKQPTHAYFLYDRGIPLWAGQWTTWLYPRLGGIPIRRGALDRKGLRAAREVLVNGELPLSAAPEGATNGHNERVSPLEPGVAQFGFWCQEDLEKASRSQSVYVVPIGIQYYYKQAPWPAIAALLDQLERDVGLTPAASQPTAAIRSLPEGEIQAQLYSRLHALGERMLVLMEGFYTRFYHQALPTLETTQATELGLQPALGDRLQALLNAALTVAEEYFDLKPKGTIIDRCRRLEQAAWDCIYREDLKDIDLLSPVERSLADWVAQEADLRMWHMRLVESFVSVTGDYVHEKPTVERFAETLLLTWETITRIKGGNPFDRPRLGAQVAQMTVGEPISVTERWSSYRRDRPSAKQAVADLTRDLQTALETMIF